MKRLLDDVPRVLGVLAIGILIGAELGPRPTYWWLLYVLAGLALTCGFVKNVRYRRRAAKVPEHATL